MTVAAASIAPPSLLGAVPLSDGRALAWGQWGPRDGWPVLFFSGAAMARTLAFATDRLDALGIRLISVDRPGIGGSDGAPGRTFEGWIDDVRQLVGALDADDHGLVAFSMGAPFAYACAAAGLPRALAVVAGQDDLRDPAHGPLLDAHLQQLLALLDADPAGFEAGFGAQAGPELIWRLTVETSSQLDRAVYLAPAFAAAYREALADGFAQSAGGYARDFVLAAGRWPFALDQIATPVDLWYGAHDESTVHSPDRGARLAQRLPHARHHLIRDAGGSLPGPTASRSSPRWPASATIPSMKEQCDDLDHSGARRRPR